MLRLGVAVLATLVVGSLAHAEDLRVSGRVHFAGPLGDRPVRVQLSRDFPGAGGAPGLEMQAQRGRFSFRHLEPGNYWLVAYVDNDRDGKLTLGKDIIGYARENPIPLGEGRCCFQTTIELDPILVELVTRFEPKSASVPARLMLESLRIVPLDPKTGRLLADAKVDLVTRTMSVAAKEGSFLYVPTAPEEAEGRYRIEISHPAYGRTPLCHTVAPRTFGAFPQVRLRMGRLEWTRPPWANVELVRVTDPSGKVLFDGPAHSPLELGELPAGSKVRVRVGRADVQHPSDLAVSYGESVVQAATAAP